MAETNPFAALNEYEMRNLVAHLHAAGNDAAVHHVLAMATNAGRNAWYEAQLLLGDSAGYAADIARAWTFAAADATYAGALQVRYALITTTLNTHAQNLPPELLAAALVRGAWSPRRALAFMRQLHDVHARARALVALLPHMPAFLREQTEAELVATFGAAAASGELDADAFDELPDDLPGTVLHDLAVTARAITDASARAQALLALYAHAPDAQLLTDALDAARELDGHERAVVLAHIAPHAEAARSSLVPEALEALRARPLLSHEDARAATLVALAPHLSDTQRQNALRMARSLATAGERARVLVALIPHLSAEERVVALDIARKTKGKKDRAAMLAAVAELLALPERARVQEESLAIARALAPHHGRGSALAALVPHLLDSERAIVIDEALADLARESWYEHVVLLRIAPFVDERQLQAMLALMRDLEPSVRVDVHTVLLERVSTRLKGSLVSSMLAAARAIEHESFRVDAFAALLPHLTPKVRERVAQEALDLTVSLDSEYNRRNALAVLAPNLTLPQLEAALELAQTVGDEDERATLLIEIATPENPPDIAVVRHALAMARARQYVQFRTPLLVSLAPYLDGAGRLEAMTLVAPTDANALVDDAKVDVLRALLPHLTAEELGAAIELVRSIGYLDRRVTAFELIVPHLRVGHLDRALAAAMEIAAGAHADGKHGGGAHHGAKALALLATQLPEPMRTQVFDAAVACALGVEWPRWRAHTIADLIPYLPAERLEPLWKSMLAAIDASDADEHDVAPLIDLLDHVPSSLRARVRTLIDGVQDLSVRGLALAAFARATDGNERSDAITAAVGAAREITNLHERLHALTTIANSCHASSRIEIVGEAFQVALEARYLSLYGRRTLPLLLPLLSPADGAAVIEREVTDLTESRSDNVEDFGFLASLVEPHARAPLLRELLLTRRIGYHHDRDVLLDSALTAALPPADAHALLTEALRSYVRDSRPAMLTRMRAVVPLLNRLGTPPPDTSAAITDVTSWWP